MTMIGPMPHTQFSKGGYLLDRDDLERRMGARSFARLMGDWRPTENGQLAVALTDRVRLLVFDGRLPLQTRVPAERELATALEVSRTTVAAAYDALRDAGVLRSRRGAGSWTQLPDGMAGGTAAPLAPVGDSALFDLAHAAPSAPTDAMRAAAAAAVHDLDAHLCGHGYDLNGMLLLRTAIAERYTERGVPTTPDQVMVTSGAQNAIALVVLVTTGPGDRVLVEHPSYHNGLDAIRAHGARPVPMPIGPGPGGTWGWDLDLFAATIRDAAPRLGYLIVDYHNPTGALLDDAGRERMVELARRTSTPLLIDETLAEVSLDGATARPVASFAPESPLLLTVGSASKNYWGGLRIGWIRSSAAMIRRLAAARLKVDLGTAVLDQLVLARLMADSAAIAEPRRAEFTASRDHLLARIAELFPQWRPTRPSGGLSLWTDLGEPVSSRLAGAARRHDLLIAAGPRFGIDGAFERYLRLPFTLRRDRMDAALERLHTAWRELDRVGPMFDTEPVAVA